MTHPVTFDRRPLAALSIGWFISFLAASRGAATRVRPALLAGAPAYLVGLGFALLLPPG